MKKNKQMGIWMDHSNAFLLELSDNTIIESIIASDFTQEEKELSLSKNENFLHSKKQQFQSSYYKKISEVIRNFQEILLFGPTDAKNELLNLIKSDHLFDKIKVEVKLTDKMTAKEMHGFVKTHFK